MKLQSNDEISGLEFTRAERILALGMVIFLLIGGAWVFNRIQRLPARPDYLAIEQRYLTAELQAQYWQEQNKLNAAQGALERVREQLNVATSEYEFRREEYRVILERGIADPVREKLYKDALAEFERLRGELTIAQSVAQNAATNMQPVLEKWKTAQENIAQATRRAQLRFEWILFLLRFAYAVPVFIAALFLFQRMRRRASNYLVFATAVIGAATLQLVYLVSLYSWHLLRDVAQIAIAVIGTALCMVGIVMIRRYIGSSERITARRTRRGQCLSCGMPAENNVFCPHCGEELQTRCVQCGGYRRVSATFCPHCRHQK